MTEVVPAVTGILPGSDVSRTASAIAATQLPSGLIPWYRGGDADVWDHVECAMALSAAGNRAEAERAYAWLRDAQRGDGSWPMRIRPGGAGRVEGCGCASTSCCGGETVVDDASDTNQCAYVAAGVWHHILVTADERFAVRMWPVVRRAVEFVLSLQLPGGEIAWARNAGGQAVPEALLTGCSSIHHSLRCAVALAEFLGRPQPGWGSAADRLADAIVGRPGAFLDRERYSMDWYYPVLGGALSALPAAARLVSRWNEFVVPDFGIRCVADRPWVTGAETCELVMALDAVGEHDRATQLFQTMQHLRDDSGSYWTGYVYADDARWPCECSTWTGAAVILAADALSGTTGGAALFRVPPGTSAGAATGAFEQS